MSTGFELPRGAWDDHIHGDGPHIGLTGPGFDGSKLDDAYRTLVETGHRVDDGGIEDTARGRYGELAVDRLTRKGAKKLRKMGLTGLEGLLH